MEMLKLTSNVCQGTVHLTNLKAGNRFSATDCTQATQNRTTGTAHFSFEGGSVAGDEATAASPQPGSKDEFANLKAPISLEDP